VRSRNSLNIGAAARAMANFGLEDLVAVAPFGDAWQVARSARAGAALLARARRVETATEAIEGCDYVIGTTAGTARTPELPLEDWRAVIATLPACQRVGLLFGSERTGLSQDDMSRCDRLVRLPTVAGAPSMNLGQAVAICAYQWAITGQFPPPAADAPPVIAPDARERILAAWYPLLAELGAVKPGHETSQTRVLREMLVRWRLTPVEERRLLGVARQVRHVLEERKAHAGR